MKLKTQRLLGIAIQQLGNLFLIACGIMTFFWISVPNRIDYYSREAIMESYYASSPELWTNFLSGAKFATSWTVSNWRTNEAISLKPMFIETNVPPERRNASYRLAVLDSKFLTWGFYEAKLIGLNGDVVLFPALGPASGTHMKWRWPISLFGIAMALITCGLKVKKSVQPPPRPYGSPEGLPSGETKSDRTFRPRAILHAIGLAFIASLASMVIEGDACMCGPGWGWPIGIYHIVCGTGGITPARFVFDPLSLLCDMIAWTPIMLIVLFIRAFVIWRRKNHHEQDT